VVERVIDRICCKKVPDTSATKFLINKAQLQLNTGKKLSYSLILARTADYNFYVHHGDNHSGADYRQGIIVIVVEILGDQIATLEPKLLGEGKEETFISNLRRLKSYPEGF
jgi:hypothetical protein